MMSIPLIRVGDYIEATLTLHESIGGKVLVIVGAVQKIEDEGYLLELTGGKQVNLRIQGVNVIVHPNIISLADHRRNQSKRNHPAFRDR
jgi:hypothetical protein